MLNNFLRTFAFLFFIPMLGFATNNPVVPSAYIITANGAGEIVDVKAKTRWSSGPLATNYLDFAHTQKTFDNIELAPGRYQWEAKTVERNNKKGKMNLDIKAKYKGASNQVLVNKKIKSTERISGMIIIEDFKSKSGSSSLAGFGKVKVHVGRAGANTNVLYTIKIERAGAVPCTYTSLGSKSGNVVGNTLGKYTSSKKACKDKVTVKVEKTGGKAKTMVTVYASDTKKGAGTFKKSFEFPNGKAKKTKTFKLNGVYGKYIRVEVKNRSAANTFKYKTKITQ